MSALFPAQTVELYLAAVNLPKLDVTSNTDPFAVIYQINHDNTKTLLLTTECIMDTTNPNWTTQVLVNYVFEEVQRFEVAVYDKDDGDLLDLRKHELCGSCTFSLGSVMCSRGMSLDAPIRDGSSKVKIRAEIVQVSNDIFECSFAGTKLANKDGFFGKSDPFLDISRVREDGSFVHVYKSEVVMNDLSPSWPRSTISLQQLCNGDLDRPLKIEVMDWDSDGKHDAMGVVMTSVRQLLDTSGTPLNVIEESKKSKRGYVNSGTLRALDVKIVHQPSFLDYIRGGCEVSLSVAIDFTGSNGDPLRNPNSLHRISSSMNSYQQAILSVGSVLEPYDTDKTYPVYGFGASILNEHGNPGPVQHCFPVYGGGYEVSGVGGILQAYEQSLLRLRFSGPTLLGPLLEYNNDLIKSKGGCSQVKQWYNVLLIITDGVITDMDATIRNIVAGSQLPLSVIIIGVGEADFSGMRQLDGDDGMLKSNGTTAARDIVQFVKFNDYKGANSAGLLAKEVLAEVPTQLVKYMMMHGISPNPPPPAYEQPPAYDQPPPLPPAYAGGGAPPPY